MHPFVSPEMASPQSRRYFSENQLINNSHFVLQQILEAARTERADVFAYESMCLWGKVLARALRLPAVSLHTTLATNKYFHPFDTYTKMIEPQSLSLKMLEAIKKLCTTYGIPLFNHETFFFHDELLNIVFFPPEFHPAVETFSKRFLFVGPAITPRLVMSIGEEIDPQVFGQLPENATLYKRVPQLDILPYTDVFLNHGGSNSVMEALYYGVPVIMLPITLEQRIFASRTQELKLGMMIENMKRITAHILRTMVDNLTNDCEIHASMQRMRKIIHDSGGYKQAADAILHIS